MISEKLRIAVFASGGGSNFQALVDAIEAGRLPAEIAILVTSKPHIGAVSRAVKHKIPVAVFAPERYETESAYTDDLLATLRGSRVGLICLAGYLKKLPSKLVRVYRNRILNVHPALLPAFGGAGMYGRRVHEAALAYGVRWSGATVHLVDEEYDTGAIVLQQPVPVLPDDTPETLAQRVLETEHQIYPKAVGLFALGLVSVEGRQVRVAEEPLRD